MPTSPYRRRCPLLEEIINNDWNEPTELQVTDVWAASDASEELVGGVWLAGNGSIIDSFTAVANPQSHIFVKFWQHVTPFGG